MSPAAIFFQPELPNAATWFYFSLLLAIALFFKFSRLLSMRNWDVLTLFLLVPGLLLLQAGNATVWYGYLWLLCGSGYFLVRCLYDLTLVRRPALNPNLNLGGLAWLGGALLVCLASVAFRQSETQTQQGPVEAGEVGKVPDVVADVQRLVKNQVNQQAAAVTHESFDASFWVERSLALLCHFAVVAGLVFIGARHFQDKHAGVAAATFYLLLPYTAIHIAQYHHVLPCALLVWAVAAYRRPALAGLLIGVAGWCYFPLLVFPVWFSFYWRRGAGRFTAAFVLAAALSVALRLWTLGDLESSLRSAFAFSDWPWIQSQAKGFWYRTDGTTVHWAYRIPIFFAYLAFVITTAFWPRPKNLAHVLALTAALIIGIQFWYADQGGVYVLWYLPLLLLLMFRPNLSDRFPPPIQPETDRLSRLGRACRRLAMRLLKLPEPLARVQ